MHPATNQMLRFQEDTMPDDPQQTASREDARLLALVSDRDHVALAALYRRRGSLIYSLLLRILVNESEAHEVLQDAFLCIWRRAGTFDAKLSNATSWMIMIARRCAMDRLRLRTRRTTNHAAYEREVASLHVEPNHHSANERDELASVCANGLHGLPDEQGGALQLAFFRGWTHGEIARATGEPLATIKARIRQGLVALRKTLREYHG